MTDQLKVPRDQEAGKADKGKSIPAGLTGCAEGHSSRDSALSWAQVDYRIPSLRRRQLLATNGLSRTDPSTKELLAAQVIHGAKARERAKAKARAISCNRPDIKRPTWVNW